MNNQYTGFPEALSPCPGEWYANFVDRYDGRYNAIQFLHNPTRFSVPPIIDFHLSMPEISSEINLDRIEKIEFDTIIRTAGPITSVDDLDKLPKKVREEIDAK